MNVTFNNGDLVRGFICESRNGLTEYIFNSPDMKICFETTAGEGINYSKVKWYMDKRTKKTYSAQKYLNKYVSLVQWLSNELYTKYINENTK